ncbi:MAG: hypothetical protein S4CHLAM20_08240 [Chlamydiia bacterium]|nr:hypothetical protein [Chlamydiia bacterium]
MYTPKKVRISHPTYFDKCLLKKSDDSKKTPCRDKQIIKDPFESSIISYIHSVLPIAGTLKQDARGFIYLDIANEYITSIIPFFNDASIDMPPYFQGKFIHGAHISIATPDEEKKLYSPLPIGEVFSFSITGCFRATPLFDIKNKFAWYLTVASEELEEIRKSMGLSALPNDETYFITVAYKKTFLSLNDLITDATKNRITLSESAILLNKLRENNQK